MTLTIDLPPEVKKRLDSEATRHGLDTAEYARRIIEQALPQSPAPAGQRDPTLALFARWDEEDKTDDPGEIERRTREWEEFAKGLDRNRVEAGGTNVRRLFPWLEL